MIIFLRPCFIKIATTVQPLQESICLQKCMYALTDTAAIYSVRSHSRIDAPNTSNDDGCCRVALAMAMARPLSHSSATFSLDNNSIDQRALFMSNLVFFFLFFFVTRKNKAMQLPPFFPLHSKEMLTGSLMFTSTNGKYIRFAWQTRYRYVIITSILRIKSNSDTKKKRRPVIKRVPFFNPLSRFCKPIQVGTLKAKRCS